MSTSHAIQIAIDFLILAAVILGFKYEPALARWERKLGGKILKAFRKECTK